MSMYESLVLADVDVSACIKKAFKTLFLKQVVTIPLMLLFYFLDFD